MNCEKSICREGRYVEKGKMKSVIPTTNITTVGLGPPQLLLASQWLNPLFSYSINCRKSWHIILFPICKFFLTNWGGVFFAILVTFLYSLLFALIISSIFFNPPLNHIIYADSTAWHSVLENSFWKLSLLILQCILFALQAHCGDPTSFLLV